MMTPGEAVAPLDGFIVKIYAFPGEAKMGVVIFACPVPVFSPMLKWY